MWPWVSEVEYSEDEDKIHLLRNEVNHNTVLPSLSNEITNNFLGNPLRADLTGKIHECIMGNDMKFILTCNTVASMPLLLWFFSHFVKKIEKMASFLHVWGNHPFVPVNWRIRGAFWTKQGNKWPKSGPKWPEWAHKRSKTDQNNHLEQPRTVKYMDATWEMTWSAFSHTTPRQVCHYFCDFFYIL